MYIYLILSAYLVQCFEVWHPNLMVRYFKSLPCFVIWGLWVTKNKMIFEEKSLEVSIMVQKIQILFKECRKITKRPSHIVIKEPTINQYYA